MVWPVVIPVGLLIITNYLFVISSFVKPKEDQQKSKKQMTVWHGEDGGCPELYPELGLKVRMYVFVLVAIDCAVCLVALSVPYAFIPEVIAYFNTCFCGNRIVYVTAAKGGLAAQQPL